MWEDLRRLFCSLPGLAETIRWRDFSGIRDQSSLEHSFVLAVLANAVTHLLKPIHPDLDSELIKDAALLHDIGEYGQERDVPYVSRKKSQNLIEYEKFREVLGCLPPEILEKMRRPFLLQFALTDHSVFPEEERLILRDLSINRRKEALIFEGLEALEYLLFVIEQHETRSHEQICKQILETSSPTLDRVCAEIEGFDLIWSPEIRKWREDFLSSHQHIPKQIYERED
jgi:5'-deoxynucleotidase YfbR-like HD superfamily hydrolase